LMLSMAPPTASFMRCEKLSNFLLAAYSIESG
jgi:hypothetical protein